MPIAPNAEVVRASFEAYMTQDRRAADRLIADGFVFTSPQDDRIGKQEFLERCFPTAGRLRSQQILQLVEAGQDGVFVMYEYELESGTVSQHRVHHRPGRSARRDSSAFRGRVA
jgi:ketosteroid isomerase-like protein